MAGGSGDTGSGRSREEDWAVTWPRLPRAGDPGDFATTEGGATGVRTSRLEIASRKKDWQPALARPRPVAGNDPTDWHNRLARARLLARLDAGTRPRPNSPGRSDRTSGRPASAGSAGQLLPQPWSASVPNTISTRPSIRASPDLPAVLSEFWVAGLHPQDFKASFPPEAQPDPSRPIPAVADPKDDLTVLPRWRSEVTDVSGYLDLAACFDGAEHISAYALAYVYSKTEQEVVLLTGSDDDMRLWLNGQPSICPRGGPAGRTRTACWRSCARGGTPCSPRS